MTAQVCVELEVSAENQQEGLVLAHDALLLATKGQAKIVTLHLENATNVSFDCVAAAAPNALPPGPLQLASDFKVLFYAGLACQGQPVLRESAVAFDGARSSAESVLQAGSVFGSSLVLDALGETVLTVNAGRGGWEVNAVAHDPLVAAQRSSWLDSQNAAKAFAITMLAHADMARVQIIDYTDRVKGPVLWKEIR